MLLQSYVLLDGVGAGRRDAAEQARQQHRHGEGAAPQAHDLPGLSVGGQRASVGESATPRSNSSTHESGTVGAG